MSPEPTTKTLEQWRLLRGFSQRELAEVSGVDNGLISLIESGKRKTFRPRTMKALSDALGVTQLDIEEFAPLMLGKELPVKTVVNHTGSISTASVVALAAAS